MANRCFSIAGLTALFLTLLSPAMAGDGSGKVDDFYGVFVGSAKLDGAAHPRDLIVSIEPSRKGFTIYSSTVIRSGSQRASKGVKWRAETQEFVPSEMAHVYTPQLRESMFTKKRDPDLLAGDTLAWASVRGKTLGVYALEVLEDGHYELRVYERTLTELGLDISFVRYKDGVPVRSLAGILARADTE